MKITNEYELPQPFLNIAKNPSYSKGKAHISATSLLNSPKIVTLLKKHDVHTRRYFYPLISDFPMYRSLPSSDPHLLTAAGKAASEVLCLPIYPDLSLDTVHDIAGLIAGQARS
mgnify:CR=1 FL=1